MIVLGVASYYIVHRELADEHIVVADDAETMAGKDVEGPFTAYSQAMVIKEHALEIGGGKTYAQLPQDDPTPRHRDDRLVPACIAVHVRRRVRGRGVGHRARPAVHPARPGAARHPGTPPGGADGVDGATGGGGRGSAGAR